jgi:hypothetical protein
VSFRASHLGKELLMSTDNNLPSTAIAELNKELQALKAELAAVTAANAWGRRVRLILLGLTVVVVLFVVVAFYNLATGLVAPDNLDRLSQAAQTRLEKNSDEYMRQLQALADRTGPEVADAFNKQVQKDLPKFLKIVEQERVDFAKNMQPRLTKMVEKRYEGALAKHESILHKEFPAVNNDVQHARMSRNLLAAIDKNLKKNYGEDLDSQFKALYATWDEFPAAPSPRPGEPSLEEQLTGNLLKLLTIKLTNRESNLR